MWILVSGRGGELDISVEAENLESLQPKNWRAQCHASGGVPRCAVNQECSKIFCAASHTVGDNKLCVIYLIYRLDLNYVMGSQLQRMVFELLELLSIVNMQL